jgi:hypothetical protein
MAAIPGMILWVRKLSIQSLTLLSANTIGDTWHAQQPSDNE